MTTLVRVVAAVFVRDNRVLACRRAPGRPAAGRWEFPGGKIETGESPASALTREIAEELGVRITVGDQLDRSTTTVGGIRIDLTCFLVQQFAPEPAGSIDHDRLQWCTPDLLPTLNWADPDLPAVARLIERSRFVQDRD